MLRKYEGIKNHVEALMAEEGEGVSLPETNWYYVKNSDTFN